MDYKQWYKILINKHIEFRPIWFLQTCFIDSLLTILLNKFYKQPNPIVRVINKEKRIFNFIKILMVISIEIKLLDILILINNQISGSEGNPFIFHSLSWSRKSDISPNGTMYAKVWTPEDPRTSKNGSTFE